MASQNWVSLLNPGSPQASGAGAPITTTITAGTTISPVTGSTADVAQVQPAGQPYGWSPGLVIRITAQGFITTTATACNYTFLLAARVGNANTTYITLATTATITGTTTALTGLPWTLTGLIRCTAIATSGNTVSTQGQLSMTHNTTAPSLNATSGSVDLSAYLPAGSGETAAAVDTTQLQGISLRATTSTAQGTVQLTQWLVEALD